MIWLAIIVPVLFALIALFFFKKQIAFWEPFIPVVVTIVLIVLFRYIGVESLTKDKEYWGNYVTEIRYYEDWNEWITQTCTRSVPCGTDSKGNTQYCTETYDCSYCLYHPEYWTMILNDGNEDEITQKYYKELKTKFNSPSIFHNMNRDYYTDDGDMFSSAYPNTYETFEFVASDHTYENKVQASTSIFNYPEVTEKDIQDFKLYEYPKIKNNKLPAILVPEKFKVTGAEQKKFDFINGKLGMDKKIRVWVCLFYNESDKAGFMQEAYWKRGNKNEFVICVGIDKDKNINWVHVFGWNKEKLIDVETRDFIYAQKKLDLEKLGDWLYSEINQKWVKISFKEFDYLSVEPPFWAILVTWILSIILCIGCYFWFVTNAFTLSDYNGDGYDEINEQEENYNKIDKNKEKNYSIKHFFETLRNFFMKIFKR